MELPPHRVLCKSHCEMLAPTWPRGYATAAQDLLREVLTVPVFSRCADGDWNNIPALLDTMPLCGWLTDARVAEIIQAAIEREDYPLGPKENPAWMEVSTTLTLQPDGSIRVGDGPTTILRVEG